MLLLDADMVAVSSPMELFSLQTPAGICSAVKGPDKQEQWHGRLLPARMVGFRPSGSIQLDCIVMLIAVACTWACTYPCRCGCCGWCAMCTHPPCVSHIA